MRVFRVDTTYDICNLFQSITDDIRQNRTKAECVLDEIITIYTEKDNESAVENAIADSASEFIVNSIETDRIKKMIKNHGISPFDTKKLLNGFLKQETAIKKRADIIKNEIKNHFKKSSNLYIDGMLNFRLSEYKRELDLLLSDAIDEYMAQKAYDEFLDLLKYFVNIQEETELIVNITGNTEDGFVLTDCFGNIVKISENEEFFSEMSIIGLKHEDVLISRLISLSPKRIYMSRDYEETPIGTTVKKIFEDRLIFSAKQKADT